MTLDEAFQELESCGTVEQAVEKLHDEGFKELDTWGIGRCNTCPLARYLTAKTGTLISVGTFSVWREDTVPRCIIPMPSLVCSVRMWFDNR